MSGIGSHTRGFRGQTDIWLTPPSIIAALGPFDLDPCAAPEPRPWATARNHITLPDDGLKAAWDGFCWLNPPYGPQTGLWLSRLAHHPGGGIALCFARTETKMFRDHVWAKADAILFVYGRPHFHYPDGRAAKGNSGGPVCLVAYGEEAMSRLCDASMLHTKIPGRYIVL